MSNYDDKLIVFDLFGVIFSKGLQSSIERLVATFNRNKDEISHTYRKWEIQFDTGKIDEIKFWQNINIDLKTNIKPKTLSNIVLTGYKPNIEAIQLARFLKRNFKVVVYSNYRREWFNILDNHFDISVNFTDINISSNTGFLKPSFETFDFLQNKYNVRKENIILIDDEKDNTDGITKWGGNGLLFKNAYETEIQLRKLINNEKPDYDYYYSGIFLKTHEGALIFQRRDNFEFIDNPGKLSVFGGRRKTLETSLQCARRELLEETNLVIEESKFNFLKEFGYPLENDRWVHCTYYIVENIDVNQIELNEGQGIEVWFPMEVIKLDDLTTIPQIIIEELIKTAEKKGYMQ